MYQWFNRSNGDSGGLSTDSLIDMLTSRVVVSEETKANIRKMTPGQWGWVGHFGIFRTSEGVLL